jgi:general secretion pathway protein G
MVLGIAGIVLSFVVIGGLLGLAALILGIVAVTRPGRKGMSITGITTGALSLPIAFVAIFFWAGMILAFSTASAVRASARASLPPQTESTIFDIELALISFEIDNARYPSTQEGLEALVTCPPGLAGAATWTKQLDAVPVDAWGRPFVYMGPDSAPDGEYQIISAGPDGTFNTSDDVKSE